MDKPGKREELAEKHEQFMFGKPVSAKKSFLLGYNAGRESRSAEVAEAGIEVKEIGSKLAEQAAEIARLKATIKLICDDNRLMNAMRRDQARAILDAMALAPPASEVKDA